MDLTHYLCTNRTWDQVKEDLGHRIYRLLRDQYGNQARFCRLMKISQPSMSAIVAGKSLPSLSTVVKIAEYINHPVDTVLGFKCPSSVAGDEFGRDLLEDARRERDEARAEIYRLQRQIAELEGQYQPT